MYTFLILFGAASIVYGMRLIMTRNKTSETKLPPVEPVLINNNDSEEYEYSFQELFDAELERIEEIPLSLEEPEDEKRRLIEGLERGEYSLDMVCSMLNMEKGEVLLLKNIYKSYQK